jgi:hypothetical protein
MWLDRAKRKQPADEMSKINLYLYGTRVAMLNFRQNSSAFSSLKKKSCLDK